ncbi:hypothetical protein Tco_0291008 [Tanacetum coccineum]
MAVVPEGRHYTFEGLQYTEGDIADFETRLARIYRREVHRVQVFNFGGLLDLIAEGLSTKIPMEHMDAQGQSVLASQAWRWLFNIRGPLVHELILEFFNTFRFRDAVLDLDTAGALQGFSGYTPSYTLIRDPMLRLCQRLIACSIAGRSQALKEESKKVTVIDLFYLRGMDVGSVNVPYLLARGAIPSKTAADAKVTIQEMAKCSQKWHNGTSRARSTKTSDGLSAIQAQLNNLRREIKKVLDLEKAKDAQAKEIADLKKRVQKLERKKKSRTTGFKRLRKVGKSRRVESSEDKDSLGDHEDASKQGRSIEDIDKDADVSLVDDTQGRSDNEEMFDTNDLHGDEVNVDMPVGEKQEQSAKEREVDTSVEDSAAPTTIEEITLAQTLIQIKAAKPKVVTTAATTTTTTRPKARGVVVQEPSEFRTPQESQPSMIKDKGKAIMIEPEVPLKRKDQVALDEDLARNLQHSFD